MFIIIIIIIKWCQVSCLQFADMKVNIFKIGLHEFKTKRQRDYDITSVYIMKHSAKSKADHSKWSLDIEFLRSTEVVQQT